MAKRKPSATALAKSLWKQAHKANSSAMKAHALGIDDHARAIEQAANTLTNSAMFIERLSQTIARCKTCNDFGSVQDSEVPYLGNPCPDCSSATTGSKQL